jgi:hypothetical protein
MRAKSHYQFRITHRCNILDHLIVELLRIKTKAVLSLTVRVSTLEMVLELLSLVQLLEMWSTQQTETNICHASKDLMSRMMVII